MLGQQTLQNAPAKTKSVAARRVQQELLQAVAECSEPTALFTAVAKVTAKSARAAVVCFYVRDEQGRLAPTRPFVPGSTVDVLDQDIQEMLHAVASLACEAAHEQARPCLTDEDFLAVAAPIFFRQRSPEAVTLIVAREDVPAAKAAAQLAATHVTLWQLLQDAAESDAQRGNALALLELLERLESGEDLAQAARTLVNELRGHFQAHCQQVVLGLCRGHDDDCRLQAVSGCEKFDKRSEFARAAEGAFDETILRQTLATWPPREDDEKHALHALQRLCSQTEAASAISFRLEDHEGYIVGVCVLLGDERLLDDSPVLPFARLCGKQLGASLELWRRADASWWSRSLRSLRRRGSGWTVRLIVLAVLVASAGLAIPFEYKIRCDTQIQPVARRFVAAPFDATLEKTLVEPGDVVEKDEVLARIDGREIRWEADSALAEHQRMAKKRDAAMAGHNTNEAQLAKFDMERLELKRQLLQHRIDHLEIRSPAAGIVVSGDLEKAEGAPVKTGQTLFEIAPLEKMTAEIAVPEYEVSYASVGQRVLLRLEAYPWRQWEAVVETIHPRAETQEKANVFIAELTLDNAEGLLRPGMKGTAKITSDRRSLAWILFHRPWEKFLQMIGI